MKNLSRSILYEARKNGFLLKIYIAFILLTVLTGVLNSVGFEGTPLTADQMLVNNPSILFTFPLIIISTIVACVSGSDMKDKVMNYELMGGYSRGRIFAARSLVSMTLATVGALLISLLSLSVCHILFGWGNWTAPGETYCRILLYIFPYIRYAAFFLMLSFVIRNDFRTMILGYISFTLLLTVMENAPDNRNYLLSLFNLNRLSSFIRELPDGQSSVSCSSHISAGLAAGTILSSLGMAAIYLFIGYAFFRRNDID